jgi:hypothetical protein
MSGANNGVWRKEYETFGVIQEQTPYRVIEYQQQLVKHPLCPRYAVQVWDDRTDRFITVHRTSNITQAKRRLRSFVAAD